MLEMEQALDRILGSVRALDTVRVPIMDAVGAFLAEKIVADIDLPSFDNSAVDGYAVRSMDTTGASLESPLILREIGQIAAGQSPTMVVTEGTACRIMTGAPMPAGADAVVMVEDTDVGALGVAILAASEAEQHVRRAGEDLRAGAQVLSAGTRVRPAEIAMLATMGRSTVSVTRAPRVAVFSTGDELVDITEGGPPPPGKIRDSNRYTLAAMVREAGATLHSIGRIPDDPEATEAALRAVADPSSGVDVVLTAGGVSVGDHDYIKPAVEKLGALDLWRVAIKPGKPLAFGRIGSTLFFGLPGNPISAMVTFELFVRPALKKMAGGSGGTLFRPVVSARLTHDLPHQPGRREYVRAVIEWRHEGFVVSASGRQGSSMLLSATAANSLLIVPGESAGLAEGARVDVMATD